MSTSKDLPKYQNLKCFIMMQFNKNFLRLKRVLTNYSIDFV